MTDLEQMQELKAQGFYCSQILMKLGLENPELVRAIQGLAGGLGFTGELCGALSGGVSLLPNLNDPRRHTKTHEDTRSFVF